MDFEKEVIGVGIAIGIWAEEAERMGHGAPHPFTYPFSLS